VQERRDVPVEVIHHPVIEHALTHLRSRDTDLESFRKYARLVAQLLCYEATRDLALRQQPIETPLEPTTGRLLAESICLVPVLRAGLAMLDTLTGMLPHSRVGFVGLEREETTAIARDYYHKLPPNLDQSRVIILDPMLATGGSARLAIELLKASGAQDIRLVCIVAAPEGLQLLERLHPDVHILTCAIDRGLNAAKFILPGLGDFGDRYFGT
jgi:uracil phosphoribosyltransferase